VKASSDMLAMSDTLDLVHSSLHEVTHTTLDQNGHGKESNTPNSHNFAGYTLQSWQAF